MADKTKAELLDELKASEKARKAAEKKLSQAEAEAVDGVAQAQSAIDSLNSTISRLRAERNDWRAFAGGHPGDRSSKGVKAPTSNPTTEARLRSERNAWRAFAGGQPGQRGPEQMPSIEATDVPEDLEFIGTTEKVSVAEVLSALIVGVAKAIAG